MNDSAARLRARNLRTLGMLAALFFLPLLLAFLVYYGNWHPAGRVNHGALITPARALPLVRLRRISAPTAPGTPLRDKWSLVYVADGACEQACRQTLYLMRQTRLALNNDMTRVERVLLARGDCGACVDLVRDNPGLTVLGSGGPEATALVAQFPAPLREYSLFVVDPLGNLMMSYDVRQDPHGLLEDLKKLLRLSHIG